MALATEEEIREEMEEGTRISDDRDLYMAVGRIQGRQEILISSVRSLEEQARENYRLLDAKIDGVKAGLDAKIDSVKIDLDAKIDGVKTDLDSSVAGLKEDIRRLDEKFNRLTIGLVVGGVLVVIAGYLTRFLPGP